MSRKKSKQGQNNQKINNIINKENKMNEIIQLKTQTNKNTKIKVDKKYKNHK